MAEDDFKGMFDSDSEEEDLGPAKGKEAEAVAGLSSEDEGEDDAGGEAEKAENREEEFQAMFGDSDSEEEDEAKEDESKKAAASVKKKLSRLSKKAAKKGKAPAKGKGKATKRQVDAEKRKEAERQKEKEKDKDRDLFAQFDSEDDEEGEATKDDKAFIEDDNLFASSDDEDERPGDAGQQPQAEEASEGEDEDLLEIDAKIKNRASLRRKRKEMDPQEKQHICRNILSRMEAAYDADNEAVKQQKPAIHKLKLLKEVESILIQRHMRETLLYESALTVMATWLNPLPDMTLPNVKIRTTLLRLLQGMKIRAADDTLDLLQKSKIARIVMFLSKVSDEIPENKKIASKLCQDWTSDILRRDLPSGPSNRLSEEITQNRTTPGAGKNKKRSRPDFQGLKLKKGEKEKDDRIRAYRPQPSQMDFQIQPASTVNHGKAQKETEKASDRRFREKFAKKQNKSFARTTKMSIEGRGL
ncbi:TFIIS N-terminal domain-containing protein [Chloropicon primus]|uniref:TFIIS N-terminal domain-containing protein n=1 Tax=Chloropicon primus TaxID=1764295 RepID=A0A5B8MX97_9CHLO|nr:hypothetical protein A3770_12p67200 [Chloropicon primus]UPR03410.1 TFIIS N-terminal domain-containing protein [Chloropicon primus]|mmetsp:Transcript_1144/g.3347  ORF Transcript_1144/g.3347 Transcript_1144/m.3347 type:complete len:472 (+) Transcript_1144:259-1674(+)|eukprot:QDZ24202.1 hypothetical protein A3770_12p67200 [Chloropicon primus]